MLHTIKDRIPHRGVVASQVASHSKNSFAITATRSEYTCARTLRHIFLILVILIYFAVYVCFLFLCIVSRHMTMPTRMIDF